MKNEVVLSRSTTYESRLPAGAQVVPIIIIPGQNKTKQEEQG